jgi:lysophospholipase L1-like esterase
MIDYLNYRFDKKFNQRMDGVHALKAAAMPKGRLAIVGDSMVQAMDASSVPATEFGVSGATSADLLRRLPKLDLSSAKAVVVSIGINDEIFALLGPRLDVAFSSVLLINEARAEKPGANETIRKLNSVLYKMCLPHKVLWIEHTDFLVGSLPIAFDCGDGVHLNAEGYRRWERALANPVAAIAL